MTPDDTPVDRVLCVIPARGGSKGLPRKNILPMAGKPLIAHMIKAAQGSQLLGHTICSTDDEEIAAVARQYGCDVPLMRPAELAQDHTSHAEVWHHAILTWEALTGQRVDILVNLQPTAPLTAPEDIDAVVALCRDSGAGRVYTMRPLPHPVEWAHWLDEEGRIRPCLDGGGMALKRRQDFRVAYVPSGGPVALRREVALDLSHPLSMDIRAVMVPAERAWDIEDHYDLVMAEAAYHWLDGINGG